MASGAAGTPLVEAARAFRPRILAERERIEAGRRLPEDLRERTGSRGIFPHLLARGLRWARPQSGGGDGQVLRRSWPGRTRR